ncbi:MAG: hypothetical protein NC548_35225 [Lachnospiraceae bacterium]|nr:hypothetical protein [Lachnospiraceae bacterium]
MSKTFDYVEFRRHVVDMAHASKLLKKETRRMEKRTWNTKNWKNDPEVLEYLTASLAITQDLVQLVEHRVRTVKHDLSESQEYIHMGDQVSKRFAFYVVVKIYWNVLLGIIIGYTK